MITLVLLYRVTYRDETSITSGLIFRVVERFAMISLWRLIKEGRMSVRHVLKLTEEEREELSRIARGSRGRRRVMAGWKVTRARALLKCDQGPWGPA